MSNFQLSIIAGLVAWVALCWLVAQFIGMFSADDRIDSIRDGQRPNE